MNFQTESYFFFLIISKFLPEMNLLAISTCFKLGNILFIGVIIFNNINLFFLLILFDYTVLSHLV